MRPAPLLLAALALGHPARAAEPPVPAAAASTLATGGDHVRQCAFDGDPATYFASAGNATQADHFTLTFDAPVAVRAVRVTTGRPEGGDALAEGALEGSADGKVFEPLAKFAGGTA